MATPKATAMAEQAARDKAQATLDEILKSLKQIKEKLGIPVLQVRAEREVESKAAEQPSEAPAARPQAQDVFPKTGELPRPQTQPVDPKAEAERLKREPRRTGNK